MTCDNLACISADGCVEAFPSGTVGQLLTIDSTGALAWRPLTTFLRISPDANNTLELRSNGYYVPGVDVVYDGDMLPVAIPGGPFPTVGVPTIYNAQTVNFSITNPSSTRVMYVHLVTDGWMLLAGVPNYNVNFAHLLTISGVLRARAIDQNEYGSGGLEAGFSGGTSFAFQLTPSASVPVIIQNRFDMYFGTTNAGGNSEIQYSWRGILIDQ